jgi:hypothetical protein
LREGTTRSRTVRNAEIRNAVKVKSPTESIIVASMALLDRTKTVFLLCDLQTRFSESCAIVCDQDVYRQRMMIRKRDTWLRRCGAHSQQDAKDCEGASSPHQLLTACDDSRQILGCPVVATEQNPTGFTSLHRPRTVVTQL